MQQPVCRHQRFATTFFWGPTYAAYLRSVVLKSADLIFAGQELWCGGNSVHRDHFSDIWAGFEDGGDLICHQAPSAPDIWPGCHPWSDSLLGLCHHSPSLAASRICYWYAVLPHAPSCTPWFGIWPRPLTTATRIHHSNGQCQ